MAVSNKAKKTWHRKGYDEGYADGREAGHEAAKSAYKITYPCSNCSGDIVLERNGSDTRSAIEHLKSQEWGHKKCN